MRFVVVGCSFRTAPIEVRERLAFSGEAYDDALAQLHQVSELEEALLVSTCNRVEVYAVTPQPMEAKRALEQFFYRTRGVDSGKLANVLYHYTDDEALKHIFRVTSSLDAMVVGEAQITGQVKDAFARATEARCSGMLLSRCMQRAFAVAKRVRTETGIARHAASVSSVAVELAGRIFDDLAAVAVLVIGAGEMAELAVRHLQSDGASRVRVINRSPERAQKLAEQFAATAVPYSDLQQQLLWADVVISSTGSTEPIITRQMLAQAMRQRKQKPLFIVDIAVPRDIESSARKLSNVYLFAVDDLEKVVAENLQARRKEAQVAEKIVVADLLQFKDWLRKQEAVPVIKMLRQHFVDVTRAEAERTAKILRLDGSEQRVVLQNMADAIVKKLLHGPTMELKRNANLPEGEYLAEATKQLFNLVFESEGEATVLRIANNDKRGNEA